MPKPIKLLLIGVGAFVAICALLAAIFGAVIAPLVLIKPHGDAPAAPVPTLTAQTETVAAPVLMLPISATRRIASFRSGQLDECTEATFVAPPMADPDAVARAVDMWAEGAKKNKQVKTLAIAKPCADQFTDRTPLATCRVSGAATKLGPGWSAGFLDTYYRVETARDDDTFMRQCLEMHGDWQASTDIEAAHEQHMQRFRKLERATE